MSLRALWIIASASPVSQSGPATDKAHKRLLFSRFYPIVEKKAQSVGGDCYVPLPPNPEFVAALLFELGYGNGYTKFVAGRDSCRREEQRPVYEVTGSAGKLWPVVVVEQLGLIFCCLPVVEHGTTQRPPLIEVPGVTLGFSLLCAMVDFLRPVPSSEVCNKVGELYSFLSQAAPFGTPLDVCVDTVTARMTNKPSPVFKAQKQPAWKPVLHKGKNNIYLAITEYIRGAQYNMEAVPDVWDLYGTVSCKAELEGSMPDITLSLSHTTEGPCLPLDHLLIHPCVQSADTAIINTTSLGSRPAPRRVRFTPPAEMITVCHYTVSALPNLPVKGIYEMTSDKRTLNLTVKLKLQEKVKNAFEYCELQLPFYNRGLIASYEGTPSQGSTMLSPDKRILVWNVGPKFQSKSLEAVFSATVQFTEATKTSTLYEDPVCVEQNAYAKLFFKITEFTHSGSYIDPKSVQVSPNTKFKLIEAREYLSSEYKIWNSRGDALTSTVPVGVMESTNTVDVKA